MLWTSFLRVSTTSSTIIALVTMVLPTMEAFCTNGGSIPCGDVVSFGRLPHQVLVPKGVVAAHGTTIYSTTSTNPWSTMKNGATGSTTRRNISVKSYNLHYSAASSSTEDDDASAARPSSTNWRRKTTTGINSLVQAVIHSYKKRIIPSIQSLKRTNKKLYTLASSLLLACSLILASSSSPSMATSSSTLPNHFSQPSTTTLQRIQGECRVATTTTSTTSLTVHRRDHATQMKQQMMLGKINYRGGGRGGINKGTTKSTVAVAAAATVTKETGRTFREAIQDLTRFLTGPKSDTLWLLSATALITPLMKRLGASPILGFLATGMLLGPNGFGIIRGIHTTETLAELGIVFFLFEMGIELSVERLMSMKRDVFGLGLGQFLLSALAFALALGKLVPWPSFMMPQLANNALVVLGGGLALSSSAFVLQLLKDKDQLKTRFGKASFGVLLFQDLAVVPLLVVTPILAGKGSVVKAVTNAVIKAAMALGSIEFAGRFVLNPLFRTVAQAKSQEAFLSMVLLTVLSMSFLTEGLGLSNTLGAFLAGVLISETKYKYQVEADIAPFRGILLGLFFVTVGFEIDIKLIAAYPMLISSLVLGIIGIKSAITTVLSMAFGLSLANAQQTGLITSQGGEFAFVAFGLAKSLGILDPTMTKVMLTSVSLTMALTPLLASLSGKIANKMEESSDFTHYLSEDPEAIEIKESNDFVVVAGYGIVGKVVCDLLAEKFINFVGLEVNPDKAIQARNKGLPVFYGDISRPEVCEAFNIGKAKAVILTISQPMETNHAVVNLRRLYPDLKIFARAKDSKHQERLQKTLNVVAMVPILPEENLLLTLPFGGAVLKSLGAPAEEVTAIIENKRKELMRVTGVDREDGAIVLAQVGSSISSDDNSVKTASSTKDVSPLVSQVIEASASSA